MAQHNSSRSKPGTLILIGGHEDQNNDRVILREIARRVGKGKLVITTVAVHNPEGHFETYKRIFKDLGVHEVIELAVAHRGAARQEDRVRLLDNARGIFFTGGDQLRITSQLRDTPLYSRIHELYEEGGVVCGTSAGASVMCDTMLVSGEDSESHHIGDLQMAPGFGLIHGVVIDQHFAERGRMGRLLGAVAKNPRYLGIGIDEDTAIVVEGGTDLRVIGSGAVYVVDGETITHSNISEAKQDSVLSIENVRLHVQSDGDAYDLMLRAPIDVGRPREDIHPQAADE